MNIPRNLAIYFIAVVFSLKYFVKEEYKLVIGWINLNADWYEELFFLHKVFKTKH